jgi:membrane protein implicated in regulation of membrane protease activity
VDSPEHWRWVWLVVAAACAAGEMASPGSFFLLPFAVGGAVAAVLAFAGVGVGVEWLAFVAVSLAAVVATRPLARRLGEGSPAEGIGARRWMGQLASVIETIPAGPNETGLVRLGREEWRAESLQGEPITPGTTVKVVDMAGTRLVVWPLEQMTAESSDSGPDGEEPRD